MAAKEENISMRQKSGYEGKCNQVLKNYNGPNQYAIDILTENGWELIGSGFFGFIFGNDNYNCVIKIPKKGNCETARMDFDIQEKLFNLTNGRFAFAKIPEPYLFNSEGQSCQYNMEKIYSLDDSENLLYQIYSGTLTYNYKYVTETQIRGWYIGYEEIVQKFDPGRLHQMVDNMGRLLVRSIIVGQIYPTDLEWAIGKTDKEINEPMSYLMDFNEVTNIVWADKNQREIAVKIAKDLSKEPYWPLNDEKYPLGEIFWNAFLDEAGKIQSEFEDGQYEDLREATRVYEDFDVELFASIIVGQFDKLMRQNLKKGGKRRRKSRKKKRKTKKKEGKSIKQEEGGEEDK